MSRLLRGVALALAVLVWLEGGAVEGQERAISRDDRDSAAFVPKCSAGSSRPSPRDSCSMWNRAGSTP